MPLEVSIEDGVHDETQGFEEHPVLLGLDQTGKGSPDEDVVQEDGSKVHLGHADPDEAQRGVGLTDALLILEALQHLLHAGDAGIADAHGEPVKGAFAEEIGGRR